MIRLTEPTRVGAALRDLRAMLGLTQVAMAELVGTTQGRYSEFEPGAVVPSIPTLVRIFGRLGYDLALIPREEPDEAAPDLEPAPSAATIASVLAIADAPYQPGLDVRFEEDA